MRLPELTDKQKEDIIDRFLEARCLSGKKKKMISDLQKEYDLTYSQLWCLCVVQQKPKLMRRYNGN